MRLYAISDLHLGYAINRQSLAAMPPHPEDWLVLAGDVGETEEQLRFALSTLTQRFAQVIWVPGNHDLWARPNDPQSLRGEAKYNRLVQICRDYGVVTPEDPFISWPGADTAIVLAPLFTLYDYSFCPDHIPIEQAVAWAAESGVVCSDEYLLSPEPYRSRAEWCLSRCHYTEQRLRQVDSAASLVLINHFPLRRDIVRLSRIPRFAIWCGTRYTEEWHTQFRTVAVVYGHLHIPATDYRDGVRFEEVSFGYPRQRRSHAIQDYLREILPGPAGEHPPNAGPFWRF